MILQKLAHCQNDDILRANLSVKFTSLFGLAIILCVGRPCQAAEPDVFSCESVGGRFGFAATHAGRGFRSGDAFLGCNLPVSWQLGDCFQIKTRLDFTAGWLGRAGENAATSSVGPAFVLKYKNVPLALEGGSSSVLISRFEFGSQDLGGPFQFRTYAGLNWDITRYWRLSYRFEHISNAGIEQPNPGLNLHTFAFSYVF